MLQEMMKSRCEEGKKDDEENVHQKNVHQENLHQKRTNVGLLYSIEDTPPWSI